MTHWHMTYDLACGHSSGRVNTTDKSKRTLGDLWPCAICGTEQEIVKATGVGA